MTEHGILFSAEMVRAILDGRKTQTRRVVKPQPPPECGIHYGLGNESWIKDASRRTPLRHTWEAWHGTLYHNRPDRYLCGMHTVACRYGQPGDRLWVREAWAVGRGYDPLAPRELPTPPQTRIKLWHLADGPKPDWAGKTRPPMFMPRWASRITLEVTRVRVERLHDITEADCIAEGIPGPPPCPAYREAWDRINAGRGFPWESNPWVWVIDFKKVTA